MRQRPPPFPSPPVRARDQPFDFEANIRQVTSVSGPSHVNSDRNRQATVHPQDLTAAPPSHYTPAMSLGGGLISLNRSQPNNQPRQHRGVMGRMRRLYSAILGNNNHELFGPHDDDDDYPDLQMLLAQDLGLRSGDDDNDDRFDHPARPYVWQEILFRGRRNGGGQNQGDYKPEYTHAGTPESGFTFDFAPPSSTEAPSLSDTKGKAKVVPVVIDLEAMDTQADTPGSGPSTVPSSPSGPLSLHTLLVCAKCLDPFVLGAGLVGEEGRTRKVWALRCGHLIDGKCLDIIGVPDGELDQEEERADGGKGNRKVVDIKGKGKAKAIEEPPNPSHANTMRARLRSSANGLLPTSSSLAPSSRSHRTPTPASSPQISLGKRKRTSASSKAKIEATHEWECPVTGCKRVHVSVKMGGVWVPEPDMPVTAGKGKGKWTLAAAQSEGNAGGRGAVAVFV